MISLQAIQTITVDPSVTNIPVLSAGSPLVIANWYLASANQIAGTGTSEYPFVTATPSFSAYAPFGYFTFTPTYSANISRACVTIHNPFLNVDQTFCRSIDSLSQNVTGGEFEYVFYAPGTYSATVALSTTAGSVSAFIADAFTIKDVPPTTEVYVTSGSPRHQENLFTAAPFASAIAYYETSTPGLSAAESNVLYFNTLLTKPGAFPIEEFRIDWGDGTGITRVTKTGIDSISNRTFVYRFPTLFNGSTDPRRYYFKHAFASTLETFTASISTISSVTYSVDVETKVLEGYAGADKGLKRLIKSNLLSNNDLVYTIIGEDAITSIDGDEIEETGSWDATRPVVGPLLPTLDIFPIDVAPTVIELEPIVSPCNLDSIIIRSLGYADDDLRIKIDGDTVSDTQWNVGWYSASSFVTSATPTTVATQHPSAWRVIVLSGAELAGYGPGSLVEIDTFDGWAVAWKSAPWMATVNFVNGDSYTVTGGSSTSGVSISSIPTGSGSEYFLEPAHFESYYPNGGFTIMDCATVGELSCTKAYSIYINDGYDDYIVSGKIYVSTSDGLNWSGTGAMVYDNLFTSESIELTGFAGIDMSNEGILRTGYNWVSPLSAGANGFAGVFGGTCPAEGTYSTGNFSAVIEEL